MLIIYEPAQTGYRQPIYEVPPDATLVHREGVPLIICRSAPEGLAELLLKRGTQAELYHSPVLSQN